MFDPIKKSLHHIAEFVFDFIITTPTLSLSCGNHRHGALLADLPPQGIAVVTFGDWSTASNWNPVEPKNDNVFIQNGGTANITQTGESADRICLGDTSGSGTINITSGTLTVTSVEYISHGGTGTITQSSGTHTISSWAYIGEYTGVTGTYLLSGDGTLSAKGIYVGVNGTFIQSGGTFNISFLDNSGVFTFSGGTLNISGGMENFGTFNFTPGTGTFNATSAIVDLSTATISNTSAATFNADAHSLITVPRGKAASFPGSFAHYSNLGILHEVGTTLTIDAAHTIYGSGRITDHVNCVGGGLSTFADDDLLLSNGLTVSAGSNIALGSHGYLSVSDTTSGMSGGSIAFFEEYIGDSGAGTFTHTGGTNSPYNLDVGDSAGSMGTYKLSDSGILLANWEHIGYNGSGTFQQTGGTNTISNCLTLGGFFSYDTGTYLLSAGALSSPLEYIGSCGPGTFTQTGGTNTIAGSLLIGNAAGINGTYSLNGGTLVLQGLGIGSGTATFNFGGGTLQAGADFATSLPLKLTGTNGPAQVNTAGHAVTFSGQLTGAGGLKKLGDNALTLSSVNTYSGDTTIGGGSIILANANALQGSTLDYGNYGGTLSFGSINVATIGGLKGSQDLSLANANSAAVTLSVGNNNQSTVYSGQLSGVGSLKKIGSGVLTLSGNNSYSGTTIVSAGTLKVANTTGSATGSGTVTVNSGAKLAGSGFIAGQVTIGSGGTLAPGNSPGILTVNNQVTFQLGSTFNAEVNGLTAGSGYDQLATTGPVALTGTLSMTFGTFTPTGHDVLYLINNTGTGNTSGAFQYADNAKIGTFDGFDWYITYDANNAASPSLDGGNDVAVYCVAVPEPTMAALLFVGGLLCMTVFAWQNRRRCWTQAHNGRLYRSHSLIQTKFPSPSD